MSNPNPSSATMPVVAAACLVAILLAGCASNVQDDPGATPQASVPLLLEDGVVFTRGNASIAQAEANLSLPAVSQVPYAEEAFESVIAATSDGSFFFLAPPKLLRTQDKGQTWTDVSPAAIGYGDPWLWVDPVTDRLFVQDLIQVCTNIHWSDDHGETWTTAPLGCGSTYIDHQKIATGVYPPGVPFPAGLPYPNVVYMGYNSWPAGKSMVSHSFDGGMTWPLTTQSNTLFDGCDGPTSNGLHGGLQTDHEGSLYIPQRGRCGTGHYVSISRDMGVTFKQVLVGKDVGSTLYVRNPELAVDAADNLYLVWTGPDQRNYYSYSADHGETWAAKSLLASPPEITTTMTPQIVAGADGRIAMAYWGIENGNGQFPECVGDDARWNLYLTWTLDARDPDPAFVTQRVNPVEDPIAYGGIYSNSQAYPDTCKVGISMPHYFGLALSPDGYVGVATTDSCPPGCVGFSEDVVRLGLTGFQTAGPNLLN